MGGAKISRMTSLTFLRWDRPRFFQLIKIFLLHLWDQVPEERKQRAICCQEFFEADAVCANISSVRGRGKRANYGQKGNTDC